MLKLIRNKVLLAAMATPVCLDRDYFSRSNNAVADLFRLKDQAENDWYFTSTAPELTEQLIAAIKGVDVTINLDEITTEVFFSKFQVRQFLNRIDGVKHLKVTDLDPSFVDADQDLINFDDEDDCIQKPTFTCSDR